MRYLSPLVLSLAACFGLQSLALHAVGGRTTKGESNFHTSLGRIQAALTKPTADIFLLGSSRTGRMPDRNSGFPGVANLGCDGGNAAITLRAIDRGTLPTPGNIVIEGDTLVHALGTSGSEVAAALDSQWFRIGSKIPNLGANARPAAFAYSLLLPHRLGKAETGEAQGFPNAPAPGLTDEDVPLEKPASELVTELSGIVARLKERGCEILIVRIPPAAPRESVNVRIPFALSHATGVPLLDLTENLTPGSVSYTDGIHMAPTSAAAALRSILDALETL